MTSIDTWPPWVVVVVIGCPHLLAFFGVVFNLYLGQRHLDAMMRALQNGRYVYIWEAAWRRQGWFGGWVLVNKIAGMVTWPRAYIQLGDINPVDIENFPPRLKRLLSIYVVMMVVASIGILLGAVLVKLR
ncbi:hypothetical protein ACN079_29650 [Pseudomonas sp. ABY48]|uniref:hypothetical protein n=1 Tax=Pseudomonas sp. ABY48 TaxID=3402865 RepID=UPI003B42AAA7